MRREFPYKIFTYTSFKNLIDSLREYMAIEEQAANNEHFQYLDNYLKCIQVKSFIWEPEYIDHDYMEDYTRYYAKCFQRYPKWCSRILFFREELDTETIEKAITEEGTKASERLQPYFLGFIVLRPLPKTLLGKVCLKTYDNTEETHRVFPILRDYTIHFLGMPLTVNSLAFQEQDNAVSACATTAIWFALHGIGYNSGKTNLPSPSEITLNAKKLISDYAKSALPNKGLLPSQMAHAMKEEGFEPLLMKFINTSYLKALLRAYLHAHVPVILGVTLMFEDEEGILPDGKSRKEPIGDHAVTATGYNLNLEKEPVDFDLGGYPVHIMRGKNIPFFARASRIDKIYVHDDRLGPFAKMTFRDEYYQRLLTEWYRFRKHPDQVNASVDTILLPLHPKVRIKFHTIFSIIHVFNAYYMDVWQVFLDKPIEWDIYLSTVCDLKAQWLSEARFEDPSCKLRILSLHMPRYIWVADAIDSENNNLLFTFLFDATDIENSDLFIRALHYTRLSFDIMRRQALLLREHPVEWGDNTFNYQSWKILSHYFEENSDQIVKPECQPK